MAARRSARLAHKFEFLKDAEAEVDYLTSGGTFCDQITIVCLLPVALVDSDQEDIDEDALGSCNPTAIAGELEVQIYQPPSTSLLAHRDYSHSESDGTDSESVAEPSKPSRGIKRKKATTTTRATNKEQKAASTSTKGRKRTALASEPSPKKRELPASFSARFSAQTNLIDPSVPLWTVGEKPYVYPIPPSTRIVPIHISYPELVDTKPLDRFRLFFDEDMTDLILTETVRYAHD